MHLITIFLRALYALLLTLPAFIWYGPRIVYYRQTTPFIEHVPERIHLVEKVVVLVHGRAGHHSNFIPLIANLQNNGIKYHFHTVNFGNNRESTVDNDAIKLRQQIISYGSHTQIFLIGLSKGGLVCMRYASKYEDERIRKIITISSPLQGTLVTHFISSYSITHHELSYQGSYVRDLMNQVEDSINDIPIYHVVLTYDHLIILSISARYNSTPTERVYTYKGYHNHITIPFSKDIADVITSWLRN